MKKKCLSQVNKNCICSEKAKKADNEYQSNLNKNTFILHSFFSHKISVDAVENIRGYYDRGKIVVNFAC